MSAWLEPIVLENAWVRLEPLGAAHRDPLRALADDPEIWRFTPQSADPSSRLAWFDAWYARAVALGAAGSELPFAVRRRADGLLAGSTRFLHVEASHRRLEVGATWYAPGARGGIVNPAAKALLLGHAFEALGAVRVELKCDARNTRSRRAIRALGAVEEGTLRRHTLLADGFVRDTVYFSVVDAEWPAVRARLHARLGVAPPRPEIHLVAVSAPGDLASAAGLLREYRSAVGSEACFAGFEAEVEGLPGPYTEPGGRIFLARDGDALAGCGALRPLARGVAEMRRMWTRPAFRGRGVGRALAEAIVAAAREEGYGALRLETLPGMAEAQALYRSLGFREIPPYVPAAAPGTLFMELGLRPGAASPPAAVR